MPIAHHRSGYPIMRSACGRKLWRRLKRRVQYVLGQHHIINSFCGVLAYAARIHCWPGDGVTSSRPRARKAVSLIIEAGQEALMLIVERTHIWRAWHARARSPAISSPIALSQNVARGEAVLHLTGW